MSALLTDVSSIVNNTITWISQFITLVTSIPLLLLFTAFPLVGYGINLLKRLVHL